MRLLRLQSRPPPRIPICRRGVGYGTRAPKHRAGYGGGNVGLMGVLADAVLKAGGEAQGIIPESLMAREIGRNGLTKLHVVRSMHERKALMSDLSDTRRCWRCSTMRFRSGSSSRRTGGWCWRGSRLRNCCKHLRIGVRCGSRNGWIARRGSWREKQRRYSGLLASLRCQ